MRKSNYFELTDKLANKNYEEGIKVVYGWVKIDQISPAMMADLVSYLNRRFNRGYEI